MGLEHCDAPLQFPHLCTPLQSAPFYRVFGCNNSYTLITFQTSPDIAQTQISPAIATLALSRCRAAIDRSGRGPVRRTSYSSAAAASGCRGPPGQQASFACVEVVKLKELRWAQTLCRVCALDPELLCLPKAVLELSHSFHDAIEMYGLVAMHSRQPKLMEMSCKTSGESDRKKARESKEEA